MIQDEKLIKMWGALLHKPIMGPRVAESQGMLADPIEWIRIHIIS